MTLVSSKYAWLAVAELCTKWAKIKRRQNTALFDGASNIQPLKSITAPTGVISDWSTGWLCTWQAIYYTQYTGDPWVSPAGCRQKIHYENQNTAVSESYSSGCSGKTLVTAANIVKNRHVITE